MARAIEAEALVGAPPERVYEFLSRLDNHWALTGAQVARLDSDDNSSLVHMRGPLGVRRTARTRVVEMVPPALMVGRAETGSGAVGIVRWSLAPDGGEGTRVRLSATVESAHARDRLVLALGGRAWLRRCFMHALVQLGSRLD